MERNVAYKPQRCTAYLWWVHRLGSKSHLKHITSMKLLMGVKSYKHLLTTNSKEVNRIMILHSFKIASVNVPRIQNAYMLKPNQTLAVISRKGITARQPKWHKLMETSIHLHSHTLNHQFRHANGSDQHLHQEKLTHALISKINQVSFQV